MVVLIAVFALSMLISLLLTPLARKLAFKVNLIDHPDGRRKIQGRAIPVAGGLAVFFSILITLGLVLLLPESWNTRLREQGHDLIGLGLASLAICCLGVLDDLGRLRGRHKLLGQLFVVGIVIAFGVHVRHVQLFGLEIDLGPLSIPFTAFLLLGAINSLNLIDGMDGLLSTVGLIVSLALAGMAGLTGHWMAVYVTLALAGALFGFLKYNFPPASIYLGDAGSMLIGLIVGVLAIKSSLKGPATIALAAPVGLLTIPIFDTLAAILRRKLTGRSIYATDRGHLHHCLLRHGLGSHRALLVVSGACLITAAGAMGSVAFNNEMLVIICGAMVIALLVTSRLFGHAELSLAVRRLISFSSSLANFPAKDKPREFEVHLQGTADWSDFWGAVSSCGEQLNLKAVRLDIDAPSLHEIYHATWSQTNDETGEVNGCWRAELPLVIDEQVMGRIEAVGRRDSTPVWRKIAKLAILSESFALAATQLAKPAAEAHPAHVLSRPHGLALQEMATR